MTLLCKRTFRNEIPTQKISKKIFKCNNSKPMEIIFDTPPLLKRWKNIDK